MRHRIIRTNGQRIAFTNTSSIADEDLRAAIKWLAREVDLNGVVIHAKACGKRRRSYGRAYQSIPSIANLDGLVRSEWSYLITTTDGRGDGWRITLAHEARHIDQFRRSAPLSELDARAFGKWAAERITR